MAEKFCKLQMLLTFVLFLAFGGSSSAPLEDGQFLRQIANQYSPPMVISFLHSRLNFNEQMIKKIEKSLTNLDKSKRDVFDLAEKTLEVLDNQLTTLEKADYFDFNGTDKVKYFIEQFIMVNQFYPIEFGSSGMVKVGLSIDGILEQLKTLTFDKLINQTNTLIEDYLSDIEDKESNVNSNHLQKLSASLARTELQSLTEHLIVIKNTPFNNNNGYNNGYNNNNNPNDPRRDEVNKVLRKLKTVTDFFYSQFNHLAAPTIKSTVVKPVEEKQSPIESNTVRSDSFDFYPEVVTGSSFTLRE